MNTAERSMTSLIYCQEAKELLEAFAETIKRLMDLHQQQFDAIVAGDLDSTRFDDLIYMANERKNFAKYAYLSHLESHGCSKFDGPDQN